jgi:hypothetical protein
MREHGRYQIQLMKTRSSSGVGMKIDLGFDIDTLRITDLDEAEQDDGTPKRPGSSMLDSIRNRQSTVTPAALEDGASAPKITAQVESTKLRQLLNNIGPTDDLV